MDVIKQIENWKKAATILAFSALALIGFSYLIGTETLYQCVIIIVLSVFFVIAVFWWYWALSQIAGFSRYMASISESLVELRKELDRFRKDL